MDERAIKKVVLDSGHGGEDPGTIANGITEKDYTLKISEYIHNRLDEMSVPNKMTRTSDVTLTPSERPKKVQSFYGNGSDVIVVSNHINAGGGDGAEIIYALRNNDTFARKIANEFENAGQNVRKYYQRRLPSDTSKDYYFIHRNTGNLEPLIVEYGFIDNTKDVEFLKENYEELAEAVISAVANYIGVPYKAPNGLITNTYVVQKGDTLYSIANKLGTTVSELKKENNLTSNTLQIGEVLRIPTKEIYEEEENIYIVKKGDSLYSIAKKYNTTVEELKRINNLTSNILSIGQVLKLPSDKANNVEKEENTISYTVQKGDSLYSIARKYDTTIDRIKDLNNLTTNLLSIGQVLLIPTDTNLETTYTVQKGDSLYSIAKKYNTTVDRLKQLNNLTSNLLSIGQILIVR